VRALRPITPTPLLSQSVQERIKEYILVNALPAGASLPPETELARQLGISRNSVREAMKGLSALGIIEVRRGSGVFVGAFAFEPLLENLSYGMRFELRELEELLEIRQVLEIGMIAKAVAALTDDQRERLRGIIARMGAHAEQGESTMEDDREFHTALFESAGNSILLRLLDTFWLTYRKATEHVVLGEADAAQTHRNHAAILDAVLVQDVPRARDALTQHYDDITQRLARAKQPDIARTGGERSGGPA